VIPTALRARPWIAAVVLAAGYSAADLWAAVEHPIDEVDEVAVLDST
jgi:hypothetical protein